MPLLFAVTLFVSASLLFMVQPMVGKLVLPLLGGSPAVWNACMVFFQALLLLGYLYADRLTRHPSPRKQLLIHMGVLALPITAFVLAVLMSARGTPISAAESLAPSDGSSAILSVLAILTVAIGVPFFVVSTSATLLQKWFTYTGHPSARDPYFLYAASNFGSLLSLLGYPLFIEPNMTQGAQTWFWACGFLALVALIVLCGRAAVNPLGVPPGAVLATAGAGANAAAKLAPNTGTKQTGKQTAAAQTPAVPAAPSEPPPSWARMAKWTVLAFVPSSLMLGVTFHMTTDIASIPLLWVGPLALYLVTFIIAFGRVPAWFRIVIGNLAPVMILLLVFLMISDVQPGTGVTLLLYNLTFFAAALMCHYELARDRPSPQYLTTYFLIMSLGGVLGGIFNSLLAPLIFSLAYEFPLVLLIACLMVPKLTAADLAGEAAPDGKAPPAPNADTDPRKEFRRRVALALDIVVPVLIGLAFWQLQKMHNHFEWYKKMLVNVADAMPWKMSWNTIYIVITFALPVMVCFFFVDRPLRFALAVAAILGPVKIRSESSETIYTERSFFGILKIQEVTYGRYLATADDQYVLDAKGNRILVGEQSYRKLVHGTTLHGTQVSAPTRHLKDELLLIPGGNVWNTLAISAGQVAFNPREEPLTYYHRTGPVGAMFAELTRRGKDKEHVAMVGLGTGSVSCFAQKGQRLTFYEIDPAVKRLVADDEKYFTYVKDAERRGAHLDFRMGDARLKLKQTDDKYALLLIDAFSSDSIPIHLLTVESVGLYLDRLKDDGILALHISNKFVDLEPVVAAIAERHKLVAWVWNDTVRDPPPPGQAGKTSSTWVALARDRTHLGDRLASPVGDLVNAYGTGTPLFEILKDRYPDLEPALRKRDNLPDLKDLKDFKPPKEPDKEKEKTQKTLVLEFLDKRTGDAEAKKFAGWIRRADSEYTTPMEILKADTGYGFRPVRKATGVDAWTDDYADVMRVMTIDEVKAVRKFFGLPTVDDR